MITWLVVSILMLINSAQNTYHSAEIWRFFLLSFSWKGSKYIDKVDIEKNHRIHTKYFVFDILGWWWESSVYLDPA